jgi:hypothetical protein
VPGSLALKVRRRDHVLLNINEQWHLLPPIFFPFKGKFSQKSLWIIPLNNRFGPNKVRQQFLNILNHSSKRYDFLCGDALDVKGLQLICPNSQLDARKICIHVAAFFVRHANAPTAIVCVANAQCLVCSIMLIVIAGRPKNYNLADFSLP